MIETHLIPTTPWGNRTELLPKKMGYISSLNFLVMTNGPYLLHYDAREQKRAFRHLFDERVTTLPEGAACELPIGDIRRVSGQLGTLSAPFTPPLKLTIAGKLDDNAVVNINCSGVVNFRGGARRALWSGNRTVASGSAFIATNYETTSATYRWLTQRQLFGVGRVEGKRETSTDPWEFDFTFDLYAAY
jgi:hypothetical protein